MDKKEEQNQTHKQYEEVNYQRSAEESSRIQRKEEGAEKRRELPRKTIVAALSVLTLLVAIGILAMAQPGKDRAPIDEFAIEKLIDKKYEAWMLANKKEFVVWGEGLTAEDLAKMASEIEAHEGKKVKGYYFDEEKAAVDFQGNEDMRYVDHLAMTVESNEKGSFATRSFTVYPEVPADASAVVVWSINEKNSFVDEQNIFHISGEVDAKADGKAILAQLKGLSGMTDHYNENSTYKQKQFQMKSGINTYEYDTEFANVLVVAQTFQYAPQ